MRRLLIRLHYLLLNETVRLITSSLFETAVRQDARKVLIVRKGSLGDLVCSRNAFQRIFAAYPHAKFHLITISGATKALPAAEILPNHWFEKIWDVSQQSYSTLRKQLQITGFDCVIELPQDVDTLYSQLRNACFWRLAGIESGGGWSITRTNWLKSVQVRRFYFPSEQERLEQILDGIGIPPFAASGVSCWYNESDLDVVTKWLQTQNIHQPFAVIAPGSRLAKKQWPYFEQLSISLKQLGLQVIAIGDYMDEVLVKSWNESVVNACGTLTVAQSAALLSSAKICISNDSGPMHLAYEVHCPVIGIFSSRNYPGKWYPPSNTTHKVFANFNVPCAGCMNAPCADPICIQSITHEQVLESVRSMI